MISALEYATSQDIDIDWLPLSSLDALSIEHKGEYAIVLDQIGHIFYFINPRNIPCVLSNIRARDL